MVSTDAGTWRKNKPGVGLQEEQAGKCGASVTCDSSCTNDSSIRHSAQHGDSSEAGGAVRHNPVCHRSSGNSVSSSSTAAATPSKRENNSERGRGGGGGNAGSVGSSKSTSGGEGGGAGNKKSESGKRSTSSRMRSLEYLFFTGRRGGTGFDCSADTAGKCRSSNAKDESGKGSDNRRQQPDLLKLAEDGFHLPDWSETAVEDSPMSSPETAPLGAEPEPTPPRPQRPTVDSANAGEARPSARGIRGRRLTSCSWPQAVVLSSHLSEADIPGTGGEGSTSVADGEKIGVTVAPTASVGVGTDQGYLSPVCRVLVVKVYTGRSQRLPPGSSGGGSSDGTGGGRNSGTVEPEVLREVWAAGFKSVCVTAAAGGHGDVTGGGDGSGDGGGCSSSSSARCQVSGGVTGVCGTEEGIDFTCVRVGWVDFIPRLNMNHTALYHAAVLDDNCWCSSRVVLVCICMRWAYSRLCSLSQSRPVTPGVSPHFF